MERTCFIVDSREQEPLHFDPVRVEVETRALPAGDYSLAGYEHRVAVERKSMNDFVGTVTHARRRFAAELRRLKELEFACVVVEANVGDVFARKYRSGAHPASVFAAFVSIVVDYRVPVFFCSDRQIGCAFVQEYLLRVHRYFQEEADAEP